MIILSSLENHPAVSWSGQFDLRVCCWLFMAGLRNEWSFPLRDKYYWTHLLKTSRAVMTHSRMVMFVRRTAVYRNHGCGNACASASVLAKSVLFSPARSQVCVLNQQIQDSNWTFFFKNCLLRKSVFVALEGKSHQSKRTYSLKYPFVMRMHWKLFILLTIYVT